MNYNIPERALEPPDTTKYGPHTCAWCHDDCQVGEDMIEYEDEYYHQECFDDNVYEITQAWLFEEPEDDDFRE